MIMKRMLIAGLALGALVAGPAAAQFMPEPPELEGRIPAPLPPPPQPPIINGPYRQAPPPGVAATKPLTTHQDRVLRCQQLGAADGLHGKRRRQLRRPLREFAVDGPSRPHRAGRARQGGNLTNATHDDEALQARAREDHRQAHS